MSTGYSAAIDTSDIKLAYVEETAWGVVPAGPPAFQQVRLTGESLSESKQRSRPNEIRPDGVVSHAITTQVGVEGSMNFALSAGTFDEFFEGALNATGWSTPVNISGATDISVTAPSTIASSSTNFVTSNITVGQWIRVSGFTEAANNSYFRVTAVSTNSMTVEGSFLTTESAGDSISITGSKIVNGTAFHSYVLEKQLASNLFLNYLGSYVTQLQINASVGNFVEGSIGLLAKAEASATSTVSSGAYTAATTGRVIDTVAGVAQIFLNGSAIAAPAQSLQLSITKQNARAQYAIGSDAAQGMGRGTIDVSGSLSLYFKDFTMYDYYKNETDVRISFRLTDNTGAGYMFTLPAATLMNPSIVAGGPDSDVLAEFQLEGNPSGTAPYSGVICQIDTFT